MSIEDLATMIEETIGKDIAKLAQATKADTSRVQSRLRTVEKAMATKADVRRVENRLLAVEKNVLGLAGVTRELIDVLDEALLIPHERAAGIKERHLGVPA